MARLTINDTHPHALRISELSFLAQARALILDRRHAPVAMVHSRSKRQCMLFAHSTPGRRKQKSARRARRPTTPCRESGFETLAPIGCVPRP